MSTPINLVLLPGLLNDARLWQQQLAILADAADISVADLGGQDSMAKLAAAVLAQAPAGPFALAGLSMGGYVALEIMRQAPQRVRALALLDTSARPDTVEVTKGRHAQLAIAENNFPEVIRILLPKLLHPDHLQDAKIAGTVEAMATQLGKKVFLNQQRAILTRIDSRPTLTRIQCPTLVLCGREDRITPLVMHEEMVKLISHATLAVVEHSGHLSALEQPEAVSTALRQ